MRETELQRIRREHAEREEERLFRAWWDGSQQTMSDEVADEEYDKWRERDYD